MEFIDRLVTDLPVIALTGVRVSGVLFLAPVFGRGVLPPVHRLWLAMLLAILLAPLVDAGRAREAVGFGFVPLVAGELAVGLLLGFTVMLSLESAKFAGQLAGVHIGFGLANIVDPVTKEQGTLIDQLQGLMVLLLFLSMGGHRMVLHVLARSFTLVPIGGAHLAPGLAEGMVRLFGQTIILGIQIAMPVLASVFLCEVAVGIVARGVPQLNIFTVGLPLRIVVGFLALSATLPVFLNLMHGVIEKMPETLSGLLWQLSP
jgi:flagellar biosynthetic protein FliR